MNEHTRGTTASRRTLVAVGIAAGIGLAVGTIAGAGSAHARPGAPAGPEQQASSVDGRGIVESERTTGWPRPTHPDPTPPTPGRR